MSEILKRKLLAAETALKKALHERDCVLDERNQALGLAIEAQAKLTAAEADREALREALAPFANRAFIVDGSKDDWFCQISVQVKHLRAARALLPRQDRLSEGEG
ncbi:hypothetical protein NKH48_13745 [Mesorhizobium sp. M1233]|uniref:hypothetical protein n=1 Tax=Mesorhizobium sp. M1233 TaxID=2957072 RepID=UPI003336BE50